MVLSESLFEWFYDKGFPSHTLLVNISGGTDIAGCFALKNPISPLYTGGFQGPSLGISIAAFEQGDKGGKKYFNAYFARYDNVWTQGDFITMNPKTGQVTFFGRSDGVLNPSGVRFGSAEIYNVIDTQFTEKVADSICVGQRRPIDTDKSVILLILMRPGFQFSVELADHIKEAIRKALSARHVPKYIFETPAIPVWSSVPPLEALPDFIPPTGDGELEKSRAPYQAGRAWKKGQALGHFVESGKSFLLQ
ncbi:acetoacetyl-CoA synthetase [Penicillium cataractarum]|uniref:Acetoacetyl-CoA synthetase n=1 Tax=Penicillium cataractarum TaxID=2100454 RepID=A0A9W9S3T4_9EURO|nr:acetoacetyl-CoA synthetase [Penicillium cataractarum]KAJ5371481.1 acetoacetyl-CoA synthetase [Penicillium cataractarum]